VSHVFRIFSLGAALAIAACSAPTSSSAIPAPDTAPSNGRGADCLSVIHRDRTPSRRHRVHNAATPNYVYVTEAYRNTNGSNTYRMEIYPAGVSNPSPIGSQCFNDPPQGVATDETGLVYVVILNQGDVNGRVDIFSDGGTSLVGTLGSSSGITNPENVAVDNNDNLYVTTAYDEILAFHHNQTTPFCTLTINIPGLTQSVAIDAAGDAFTTITAETTKGLGVKVGEFPGGCSGTQTMVTTPLTSGSEKAGIAFDASGDLVLANGTAVDFYTYSSSGGWQNVKTLEYSDPVGQLTAGPAGELYIPLRNSNPGDSSVVVIPNSPQAPYSITNDTEGTVSAAGGV
jgi:hypothetical protein